MLILEKSAEFDICGLELDYQRTGKALEGTITELDQHMEDILEREGEHIGFKACD